MQRHCAFIKAKNGKWYLELGNFEYADSNDSTTYGPFDTEEAVEQELRLHSNPGGRWTDDSGTAEVPTDVVAPRRRW